ncbi:MAG: hypothetical protein N0C90_01340 [Candidatus Thiodiazotropha endolucinida]|nr:hypothetical protein [Candidatus Thiodiazotropha taylori]MCG8044624.1 hypothetical protein [Candidatus Thiodiazotropha taylori]MCW4259991.1 hypothetical protein [Candidatus Thiodiazotropha endolucinida]MCW4342308.1 hypothetical protein [Candidatus Thiodiazotropha endolucinida]
MAHLDDQIFLDLVGGADLLRIHILAALVTSEDGTGAGRIATPCVQPGGLPAGAVDGSIDRPPLLPSA